MLYDSGNEGVESGVMEEFIVDVSSVLKGCNEF